MKRFGFMQKLDKNQHQAQVKPQHGKRQGVDRAVDIAQGREFFNIDGEQVGNDQPAQACQQRPGDGIPDPVPSVGQESENQNKLRNIAATDAEIAKAEREAELRQREIELKEYELTALVHKQADADKYLNAVRKRADVTFVTHNCQEFPLK